MTERYFQIVTFGNADECSISASCIEQSAANSYLLSEQRFLRQLSVLIYWSPGLSPCQKELLSVEWCNQETARNLCLSNGLVVFITGYHKSPCRIGTRPIARFLHPAVAELLVRYLIYVPVFVRFLGHCMQYPLNRGYLFCERDRVWTADRFGDVLKRQSACLLGFPVSSQAWRHILIAIDRRLLQGFGCKQYEVSQHFERKALHADGVSDSELDGDYDDVEAVAASTDSRGILHSWQAYHTPTTNRTSYGTDVSLQAGLKDALLTAYLLVSQTWHRDVAFKDSSSDTASSHKRSSSPQRRTQHPWSKELGWILACKYDENCGRGRPSNNVSVNCSIRMQALAVSSNVRACF